MPALNTRSKGALKFMAGCLLFGSILYFLSQHHLQGGLPVVIVIFIALPGVLMMIGLLEMLSATPLQQFTHGWNQLTGWQRGLYGTLIVLVGFMIIFGTFLLIALKYTT